MDEPLAQLESYKNLTAHFEKIKPLKMRDMFAQDKQRFNTFSVQLDGFLFDYSKNRITEDTISNLTALFNECAVPVWREKMFSGEKINATENRGVQHIALRDLVHQGSDIAKQQSEVLDQIGTFIGQLEQTNIKEVVNIGIGGSHLGPQFVCDALQAFSSGKFNLHFVANVDAEEINRILKKIKPEQTLFIVTSKSFSTQETLANAALAKDWIAKNSKLNNADHFVAISTNKEKAIEFGIAEENIFPMWDEIGGRYSLWSSVGLSIAISIGIENFRKLLNGARRMDEHFLEASPEKNIPVLMALLELWNHHFLGTSAHAILPYDVRLNYLPAYLQQLVMESNGKSVDRDGKPLFVPSSTVLFGDVGTNAQHSFFQLLHQGTEQVSCDFVGVAKPDHDDYEQHNILMANMMAQTQALMMGQTLDEAGDQPHAEHKIFSGNRVSNTIFLKELTPFSLGMLLAAYEHKTFVHGILLDINSFDQMGVELGKKLASRLFDKISQAKKVNSEDSSTNGLLDFYRQNQ